MVGKEANGPLAAAGYQDVARVEPQQGQRRGVPAQGEVNRVGHRVVPGQTIVHDDQRVDVVEERQAQFAARSVQRRRAGIAENRLADENVRLGVSGGEVCGHVEAGAAIDRPEYKLPRIVSPQQYVRRRVISHVQAVDIRADRFGHAKSRGGRVQAVAVPHLHIPARHVGGIDVRRLFISRLGEQGRRRYAGRAVVYAEEGLRKVRLVFRDVGVGKGVDLNAGPAVAVYADLRQRGYDHRIVNGVLVPAEGVESIGGGPID